EGVNTVPYFDSLIVTVPIDCSTPSAPTLCICTVVSAWTKAEAASAPAASRQLTGIRIGFSSWSERPEASTGGAVAASEPPAQDCRAWPAQPQLALNGGAPCPDDLRRPRRGFSPSAAQMPKPGRGSARVPAA